MSRLIPTLTLAVGIILGTLISARLEGWLVLLGPIVMATAIVAAAALERSRGGGRGRMKAAGIVAVGMFLACAMVALRDFDLVAMTVALVGATSFAVLIPRPRRSENRC